MRNCDWTEKVSLLIDGELDSAESRAVETHIGDCLACRAAREDFLLLRRRLSSYQPEVNLVAQRDALQNILAAGRGETAHERFAPAVSPGRRSRLAELFALPRLNPGLVAASALLVVGVVVGIVMLGSDRRTQPVEIAKTPQATNAPQGAPRVSANGSAANQNDNAANDSAPAPFGDGAGVGRKAQAAPLLETAKIQPRGVGGVKDKIRPQGVPNDREKFRPKGAGTELQAKLPREIVDVPFVIPPRVDVEALEFNEADLAANVAGEPSNPAPAGLSTARHAEQAQLLLRSFRNASATDAGDLAYERERSQELLYQNIVLRREAARGGRPEVESTLSQLETILLDIANLPDKPASDDVRSIKRRMERKNIVAMLQVAARD